MLNLFSTGVLTRCCKNKFGFGYPQTLALFSTNQGYPANHGLVTPAPLFEIMVC